MRDKVVPSNQVSQTSNGVEEKDLTATRFAKIYLSSLWRSMLLSFLIGALLGMFAVFANVNVDSISSMQVILVTLIITVGINWYVRYHVYNKVVWSDFRMGFVENGGEPGKVSSQTTLVMTIYSLLLTLFFGLSVFFIAYMGLEYLDFQMAYVEPVADVANGFLGIYAEYLILKWFIKYDLKIGGTIVLYGDEKSGSEEATVSVD